jgi:DivIVA domain-containing protein
VGLAFTLLVVLVLGLVVAVALGWIGGGLEPPTSSLPPWGLPEGAVRANDLDRVRFAPALRGYRMDQVDATLDRLAGELARRDTEIARLRHLVDPATDPLSSGPIDLPPSGPIDVPPSSPFDPPPPHPGRSRA